MCGRYSLMRVDEAALKRFDLFGLPESWVAHYNIAPTVSALIVRKKKDAPSEREGAMARFGLIPPWSTPAAAAKMINARAETVADKPAFREALSARRCLVPADGFFEWKRLAGQKSKQPYWFQMEDRAPFAFAGLWERWYDPAGVRIESFAILTTRPNSLVAGFHDRMPVILGPEAYTMWLDPAVPPPLLEPLYEPIPAERMIVRAVSMRLNNARNDDPGCVEEVTEAPPPKQGSLF